MLESQSMGSRNTHTTSYESRGKPLAARNGCRKRWNSAYVVCLIAGIPCGATCAYGRKAVSIADDPVLGMARNTNPWRGASNTAYRTNEVDGPALDVANRRRGDTWMLHMYSVTNNLLLHSCARFLI